ncbi:MAG: hypothetical protein AAGA87_01725 [Pseudomonadota bacterium]
MAGGWSRTVAAGATCVAAIIVPEHWAGAQDAGGLQVTGSVRFGAEYDDNSNLSATNEDSQFLLYSDVSLGLVSETPTSRFAINVGGRIQYEDLDTGFEENGFVNPNGSLSYSLEGADSRLELSASIREADVLDELFLDTDGDLLNDAVISSVGTIQTTRYGVELEFGQTAPIGGALSYSRRERDYSNTVSPDLFDTETDTVRATINFRPRQTLTFRTFVEQTHYEADDVEQTDRTTTSFGIGTTYEIDPILTFDGEVSFREVDETTILGRTETDGVGLSFTLTREMPNGSIALFGDRNVTTDTTRTQLGVRREMELPRGSLGYSLAVSDSDTGDLVLLGTIDYLHETPNGEFTVALNQTAVANDDDEEVLRTSFDLGYSHELTPVSNIGVSFGLDRTDDIGNGAVTEGTSARLSVVYSQQLTEDWDWQLGYEGRRNSPETGADATSNRIFATIGRSFSIRP